jgi:hypothetical protein
MMALVFGISHGSLLVVTLVIPKVAQLATHSTAESDDLESLSQRE